MKRSRPGSWSRRLISVPVVVALALGLTAFVPVGAGPATLGVRCEPVRVDVAVVAGGPEDHWIAGTLYRPRGSTPDTVQLLVHGGTYARSYWDWPTHSPYYSYMRAAVAAGYATLSVDRLGVGQSSHPPSSQVALRNGATALHGVVSQLRSGGLAETAFDQVVWVGHSFGSIYAWTYATLFQDIAAFALTGAMHTTKPSWLGLAFDSLAPIGGALDPGYLTTLPGRRADLFYYPATTRPAVVAADEASKDTITTTEIVEGTAPTAPEDAASRSIGVPTLLVLGEQDNLYCGPPDGPNCTEPNVTAIEGPYYSPTAQLEVETIPHTGHVLSLHLTAPLTHATILRWTLSHVPPGA